jgi:hypothetical protein
MSVQSSTRNLALESAAADLVHRLGGHWTGAYGMCRCPAHDDSSPSLSVRVGARSLLFKCFAGCDTIAVLRAIRRCNLDIPSQDAAPVHSWQPRDRPMMARAQELWDDALPFAGSPAEHYARGRALAGFPGALRYHPRTPLGPRHSVRFRPALLAAVRSGERIVAVERLFLDCPPGRAACDLDPPKRLLGRPRDGAVRFGAAGVTLGLAEGWETAWSAFLLLGIPVWATLGSERFPHVFIPPQVDRLILLPDNDAAGMVGADKAILAHERPGRSIGIVLPQTGHNDWNDQLTLGGEGGGEWLRKAA